jgi:predicted dehydrogenase
VSIAALKAGCHVLVEKPMAASIAEAKRMMQAAKSAKRLLMVNHSDRLKPVHRKAREILASGILGKPLLVSTMFGHEGPEHWSPKAKWFFRASEAKFGAMADLGIHKADLLRFLTGEEVAEVAAFTARLEKKGADVEDNCVAALRFASGALGTLTASWTTKGMFAEYTILHCTKGTLRINEIPGKPLVANLSAAEGEWVIDVPPGVHRYEGSWGIDAGGRFVDAVLGDAPPYATPEDGLKSLAIVLAAEKSARTRRSVRVDEA